MANKTYTRTGDDGTTSLIGGKRVPKYDDRVVAYGTVDELGAFLGVLSDLPGIPEELKADFGVIQDKLFILESHFAADCESESVKALPSLSDADVAFLEGKIDAMNAMLPALRAFVVPGGNIKSSVSHVCRTVCRRAERQACLLAAKQPVDCTDMKYLNRLSDYFFVMARYLDKISNVSESHWESNK